MPCPSRAGGLGVCLLLLHAPAGAIRGQSEPADATREEDEAALRPPLCDPTIVRETCVLLGSPDPDGNVTWDGLRTALSASSRSAEDLWRLLGLDGPVPCALLCSALVGHAGEAGVLPPSSDVACYAVGTDVRCDLDVGPRVVSNFSFSSDLPDFHDRAVMMKGQEDLARARHARSLRQDPADDGAGASPNVTEIDYGAWEAVERAAELFRIYPARADDFGAGGAVARLSPDAGDDRNPNKRAIQLGVKAMAYMNSAARKVRNRQTRPYMRKWFGSQDAQAKVLSVINSVIRILNDVQYVYPGQRCSQNTYAYVFPEGVHCSINPEVIAGHPCRTNARGQHVVYLCPYYFKVTDLERIETLVHEASHHEVARTDDVCVHSCGDRHQAQIAYGRRTCLKLAEMSTNKALRNADSYCYYISDVIGSNTCPAHARFRSPNEKGDCECPRRGTCRSTSSKQGCYSHEWSRDRTYFHPLCETCHCGGYSSAYSGAAWLSPHLLALWLGTYLLLGHWVQGL